MQTLQKVIVIGGGVVGLTQALALGQAGLAVTLIAASAAPQQWQPDLPDAWVSALNPATQRILTRLGVWQQVPQESRAQLQGLKVWDQLGGGAIEFAGDHSNTGCLGHVVANRAVVSALWQAVKQCPRITALWSMSAATLAVANQQAALTLEDGQVVTADLIIGADGANSWLRQQLAIDVSCKNYQQAALIATVASEREHGNVGWQVFLPSGPLAYLPLHHPKQGALVWSAHQEEVMRLQRLAPSQFSQELSHHFGEHLGSIELRDELRQFELSARHASHYVKPRVALVGDAAHTIHPLAGQGANLGIMDAACLTDVLLRAQRRGRDLGTIATLRRYERWRRGDNACLLAAMTALNTVFSNSNPVLAGARSTALSLANRLVPLKKAIIHQASGWRGELPSLLSCVSDITG